MRSEIVRVNSKGAIAGTSETAPQARRGEGLSKWVRHAIKTPGYFLGLADRAGGRAPGSSYGMSGTGTRTPQGVAEWTSGARLLSYIEMQTSRKHPLACAALAHRRD